MLRIGSGILADENSAYPFAPEERVRFERRRCRARIRGGDSVNEPSDDSTLGVLSCYSVIRTLADDTTRDIWNGVNSKAARRIPRERWPIVHRKLDQVDAVTRLDDLKVPPGNRLHALGGDLRGFHAVRVNDQYRIVFRFEGADAFDVR
jgi:proteic killer suppression protein